MQRPKRPCQGLLLSSRTLSQDHAHTHTHTRRDTHTHTHTHTWGARPLPRPDRAPQAVAVCSISPVVDRARAPRPVCIVVYKLHLDMAAPPALPGPLSSTTPALSASHPGHRASPPLRPAPSAPIYASHRCADCHIAASGIGLPATPCRPTHNADRFALQSPPARASSTANAPTPTLRHVGCSCR